MISTKLHIIIEFGVPNSLSASYRKCDILVCAILWSHSLQILRNKKKHPLLCSSCKHKRSIHFLQEKLPIIVKILASI